MALFFLIHLTVNITSIYTMFIAYGMKARPKKIMQLYLTTHLLGNMGEYWQKASSIFIFLCLYFVGIFYGHDGGGG